MLSHAAFLGVGRYYIDWFKQGTPPAIHEDALFYAYRTHLKSVPGLRNPKSKGGETAFPGGTANLSDHVHATLFLTAPASLTVHSGDTSKRFDLGAGVSHVALPLAPGPQRFVLTRGPDAVLDKTGEHTVSATDAWGNFNLFAGEAHPLPASPAAGAVPASQTPGSSRLQ